MIFLWHMVCGRAIVDNKSNLISLIDVTERVILDTIPPPEGVSGVRVKLQYVAAFWRNEGEEAEEIEAKLAVKAPNGASQHLADIHTRSDEANENSSLRIVVNIDTITFGGLGVYHISFSLKLADDHKGRSTWQTLSIPIIIAPPSAASIEHEQPFGQNPVAPVSS